jgi:hypothetical protein
MDEQQRLSQELAITEARLKAVEETFREALAAVLLRTAPAWHFSAEELEHAKDAHFSYIRELDDSVTVSILPEDEDREENETGDYFAQELNKRLGFDVRDLQALMEWWNSFMKTDKED